MKGSRSSIMELTDIHSHILPGLDDGAKNQQESLSLVRMAYEQGITHFIATPHYSPQFHNCSPALIRERCLALEEEAKNKIASEIRIYPGQEIYWEDGALEKLDAGELLTMADSSYVLIEFMPQESYRRIYQSLRTLRLEGYLPILAHAERYGELRKKSLDELVDTGVLIQMNYGSVGSRMFDRDERWCRKQLKEGLIHFLGTDMHSTDRRPPATEKALTWMQSHLEEDEITLLCREHGEQIIMNQSI